MTIFMPYPVPCAEVLPLEAGSFADYRVMLASVLMVVLAIVCVISLTVLAVSVFRGERESAHKLVSWVIVSAAGFALLAVIRDL